MDYSIADLQISEENNQTHKSITSHDFNIFLSKKTFTHKNNNQDFKNIILTNQYQKSFSNSFDNFGQTDGLKLNRDRLKIGTTKSSDFNNYKIRNDKKNLQEISPITNISENIPKIHKKSKWFLCKKKANSNNIFQKVNKLWINSENIVLSGDTFYKKYSYYDINNTENPEIIKEIEKIWDKFPPMQNLYLELITMSNLGDTLLGFIDYLLSSQKLIDINELKIVSFASLKTLWNAPMFMISNFLLDCEFTSTNKIKKNIKTLEIVNWFRMYYDRGLFQNELFKIIEIIKKNLSLSKISNFELVISSFERINDEILMKIIDLLPIFASNLNSFKLYIAAQNITDDGLIQFFNKLNEFNLEKLSCFYFGLDFRSKKVTEKSFNVICDKFLRICEKAFIEYFCFTFVGNNLTNNILWTIGETISILAKNLKSLIIMISCNLDDDLLKLLLEDIFKNVNEKLEFLSLGFLGRKLTINNGLEYLKTEIAENCKNLKILNIYFNNSGSKNRSLEEKTNSFFKKNLVFNQKIELNIYTHYNENL